MIKNIQKKISTAALTVAVLTVSGAAHAQEIRTTVDGNLVTFSDVQPVMINGRVLVPVRGVFEHMNSHVEWDKDLRMVTAHHGSDTIALPINSYSATVNGRSVRLDSPATIHRGRTMVPLRFLSESLGAGVEWIADTRTVEILTVGGASTNHDTVIARIEPGTVTPFTLNSKLSSNASKIGDRFTATLDTGGNSDYSKLPAGTTLEGRVVTASRKAGDTPGVLGLEFDRVVLPSGKRYAIAGVLHGLDGKSVRNENGKLTAKAGTNKNNLKYVGYGAGAGALVSILTKGNLFTTSLIGAALGFLVGEIEKNPSKSRDVTLDQGTRFGVRLTNELAFRVPVDGRK